MFIFPERWAWSWPSWGADISRLRQIRTNRRKTLLARAVLDSVRGGRGRSVSLEDSARATYGWLCAAQDATPDDGVAAFYDLLTGEWSGSYPETTGYIIPTFLTYAEAFGAPDARERALRMAEWETSIQMEDGAVLSGALGTARGPAVFNTGQGLFGWVAAHEATGDERYATAAGRAADWLVTNMDDDGAWRRNLSMITTASVCAYNVRCSWALAYAGTVLREERFLDAARRNADWTAAQQNDAGWYEHTAFSEGEDPTLHAISYVIEGLLGVHAFTGEERYLHSARRALDHLVAVHRAEGRLHGIYDAAWRPAVSWRCVTGDAQQAVLLHRFARLFPGEGYELVARALLHDVARGQLQAGEDDPTHGAVTGALPVWGRYMSFAAPNWAAKFFLDGLMLELRGVDEKSWPGQVAQA